MRKIKYLTPILGLSAMVGAMVPITTACAKAVETKVLPYNLLQMNGVTVTGVVKGTDLTKYDTIDIPEGTKAIAVDAFRNVEEEEETNEEESTFDYSTITKLVLPSTLRTVDAGAFLGLTNLKSIDCTAFNADTIQYLDVADFCINEEGEENSRFVKINLPEGLTLDQTSQAKSTFAKMGVPEWCFVDQTTGHIAATEGASKTLNSVVDDETIYTESTPYWQYALAEEPISLTLTDTFDVNKYTLKVYPQRTAATADYDYVDTFENTATITDNKVATITPYMSNTIDKDPEEERDGNFYPMTLSEGHTVDFDVNVVCTKNSTGEVVWTEKVEGYKISPTYTHVTSVAFDEEKVARKNEVLLSPVPSEYTNLFVVDEANIKVSPTNACNKELRFKSDNEYVLNADKWEDEGTTYNYLYFTNMFGTANATVYSLDDTSKTDTIEVSSIGAYMVEGLDDNDNHYMSTWYGHIDPETGYEEGSYGYIIPSTVNVLKYSIKVGYDYTWQEELPAAQQYTTAYAPHYSEEGSPVRTFRQNQCIHKAGGYEDEIIPIKAANIHINRADPSREAATDLVENKHYVIDSQGFIELLDGITDPDVVRDITFDVGDEITFEIELQPHEARAFTGFAFKDQTTA